MVFVSLSIPSAVNHWHCPFAGSTAYSLGSFVDEVQLDQQPVEASILHVLGQLVLENITLRLQCVQLRVEPGSDHGHQIRDGADIVRKQVAAGVEGYTQLSISQSISTAVVASNQYNSQNQIVKIV